MQKLTREVLNETNKDLDPRIVNYLDNVVVDLMTHQKENITLYTKEILILLVAQLILYFKSFDAIFSADNLSSTDAYKRTAKSPEINILQKAHDQILNLFDKLCLSPMGKVKLSKLTQLDEEQTAKDLLNDLTS